jgi:hypothetical protein
MGEAKVKGKLELTSKIRSSNDLAAVSGAKTWADKFGEEGPQGRDRREQGAAWVDR